MMMGLSKEQVLACMGSPGNSAMVGSTEVWTYDSGNGRTDTFGATNSWGGRHWAGSFTSSTTTSRFCKVDIVMNADRVTRINYTGPTGGLLTKGEQCAYAIENCVHQGATVTLAPAPQQSDPQISAPPAPGASAAIEETPGQHVACTKEDEKRAYLARVTGRPVQPTCD
jgi:hypothetical protein